MTFTCICVDVELSISNYADLTGGGQFYKSFSGVFRITNRTPWWEPNKMIRDAFAPKIDSMNPFWTMNWTKWNYWKKKNTHTYTYKSFTRIWLKPANWARIQQMWHNSSCMPILVPEAKQSIEPIPTGITIFIVSFHVWMETDCFQANAGFNQITICMKTKTQPQLCFNISIKKHCMLMRF